MNGTAHCPTQYVKCICIIWCRLLFVCRATRRGRIRVAFINGLSWTSKIATLAEINWLSQLCSFNHFNHTCDESKRTHSGHNTQIYNKEILCPYRFFFDGHRLFEAKGKSCLHACQQMPQVFNHSISNAEAIEKRRTDNGDVCVCVIDHYLEPLAVRQTIVSRHVVRACGAHWRWPGIVEQTDMRRRISTNINKAKSKCI